MNREFKEAKVVLFKKATILSVFLWIILYYKKAIAIRVSHSIKEQLTACFNQGENYDGPLIVIHLTEERITAFEEDESFKREMKTITMDGYHKLWFIGFERNLKRLRKLLIEGGIERDVITYYSHTREDEIHQIFLTENSEWKISPATEATTSMC